MDIFNSLEHSARTCSAILLYIFLVGNAKMYKCTNKFPRDILQTKSTYVDVDIQKQNTDQNDEHHNKSELSVEQLVFGLIERCDKHDRFVA